MDDAEDDEGDEPARGIILGLDNMAVALLFVVPLWIVLGAIGYFVPPVALVLLLAGFLLGAAGGIWLLIIAFQEDVVSGFLCLVVPFYALVFVVTHLEIAGRAFAANVVGSLMCLTGVLLIVHSVGTNWI